MGFAGALGCPRPSGFAGVLSTVGPDLDKFTDLVLQVDDCGPGCIKAGQSRSRPAIFTTCTIKQARKGGQGGIKSGQNARGLHYGAGLAKSGCEQLKFSGPKTCPFGPLMARFRLSRRRGWILRVRELSVRGSRARYDIWDPISGRRPRSANDS